MILGMPLSTFTTLHVIISLVAIAAGVVVLVGMLAGRSPGGMTALFLATTALTSMTGFLFPFDHLLPSHIVGIISLVALAVALLALYGFHLRGAWRWLYVVGALLAFYLTAFVGVVQAFQKLGVLHPLAPTQSEPPFLAAQIGLLVLFLVLGFLAARRFHPASGAYGA
jgi:hypothetical protein